MERIFLISFKGRHAEKLTPAIFRGDKENIARIYCHRLSRHIEHGLKKINFLSVAHAYAILAIFQSTNFTNEERATKELILTYNIVRHFIAAIANKGKGRVP